MRGATTTTAREPRSRSEWVALAGSCVVLAILVLLIVGQLLGDRRPPAPVVTIEGPPRTVGALHHVEVILRNDGDDTAAAVQVTASLGLHDEVVEADQTVDFLAGGEEVELVFVFSDDPGDGDLTVEVAGFAVP